MLISLQLQANKMLLADLPSLPGSNVSKGDLPDGPKPLSGDAGNKVCNLYAVACVVCFLVLTELGVVSHWWTYNAMQMD